MSFFHLNQKWFYLPLLIFLCAYSLLRAWFVTPLLDELGTFYMYIQTGKVLGNGAIMDANNHIINSYFGAFVYRFLGDSFFLFRFLSLLSIPIFFFSTKYLVEKIVEKKSQLIVFISLNTIPWIVEYYSYSRGYAFSLAVLFSAFCCLIKWKESKNTRFYSFYLLFLLLACTSNMSLVIPVILLFGYSIILLILNKTLFIRKYIYFGSILFFVAYMTVVYFYLHQLKIRGALWWGSTEGLWEVTGKSISKTIFFTDSDYLKYLILLFLAVIIIGFLFINKGKSFRENFESNLFWINMLLFSCLTSFVFMAKIMHINYPMDRVGMYLVPVFLLALGATLSHLRIKWLLLLLIWFPISFVWKMNLNTSIFSPEDRIQSHFMELIERKIENNEIVSMDYVSHLSYAYQQRKKKNSRIAVEYNGDSLTLGDYHVSWVNEISNQNYKCVYREPVSGTRLYKKTTRNKLNRIAFSYFKMKVGSNEIIDLYDLKISDYWKNKRLKIVVDGKVEMDKKSLNLNLSEQSFEKDSILLKSEIIRFNWYFGNKTNFHFHFENASFLFNKKQFKLKIALENKDRCRVKVKDLFVKIYVID